MSFEIRIRMIALMFSLVSRWSDDHQYEDFDQKEKGCLDVVAGIKVVSGAEQAGVDELPLPQGQVGLLQRLLHLTEKLNHRQR